MKIKRTVYAPNLNMEMEFELTPDELKVAYIEQQHEYDVQNIRNELDCQSEYYDEHFGIGNCPVTDDEVEDMVCRLQKLLDEDPAGNWSGCVEAAVTTVLSDREER